jgi:hypothetical protein
MGDGAVAASGSKVHQRAAEVWTAIWEWAEVDARLSAIRPEK